MSFNPLCLCALSLTAKSNFNLSKTIYVGPQRSPVYSCTARVSKKWRALRRKRLKQFHQIYFRVQRLW